MTETNIITQTKRPEEQLYEAIKGISDTEKLVLLGVAKGMQLAKNTQAAG